MGVEGSVGRLLSRSFGVVIALIAGCGLVELGVVLVQQQAVRELTEEIQPMQLANDRLGDVLGTAQWGLRSYLVGGDKQMVEIYGVAKADYTRARAALLKLGTGEDHAAEAEQVAKADAWWAATEALAGVTPRSNEATVRADQITNLYQVFTDANQGYQDDLASRAADLHTRSEAMQWITIGVGAALTAGATVVALRTSARTRRRITGPLDDIVDVLERRRGGDRDVRAQVEGLAVREIRAVAEAINAAADQTERVRRHEEQMMARLTALDTAKTDFMSTVSHELRTPLTSISGYLELLRDSGGELTDAQRRMLEVIARNARRLRELIEDILTSSQIESGEFRSHLAEVDLADLVERAVEAAGPAAAKASVGLHTDVRGPLPLQGDGPQLDRVLANLLGNAVKFTPAEGTVTIRAEQREGETVLVIADTGMGIPEDERNALFARFFRASNAIRQAVPGTGLGLAIVHTIVDNHGGTIEVESTEDVGTTVTMRLPALTAVGSARQ